MAKMNKLFVFALLLCPQFAFSWGFVAHRATAYIAEANLTENAKDAVKEILGDMTMADAAVWADSLRDDPAYKSTLHNHFGNVPLSYPAGKPLTVKGIVESPDHQPGVLEAILENKKILANPASNQAQKFEALKFLIHFIGDAHQPLHTGYEKDHGGNTVRLTWFGRPDSSLHGIWDSQIIYQSKSKILTNIGIQDAGQIYARNILQNYTTPVPNLGTVGDWYQESLDALPITYVDYDKDQDAYTKKNEALVDTRVRLAGLRIADTLNFLFDASHYPTQALGGQKQIKKLFSQVDGLIQLGPNH